MVTKPVAAAVAGALIAGTAMYTVGAKTARVDAFQTPALVQTVDGGWVEADQVTYDTRPVQVRRLSQTPAPRAVRTIETQPVRERVVVAEAEPRSDRSWQKTAMIIGGSAAAGAGTGGIIKGKKGALIGAAIGGGAASIYEATRRR